MTNEPEYDVALSFAGTERKYVHAVAELLKLYGFKPFYDEFARDELLGQEQLGFFQSIYSTQSLIVAQFISQEWVARPWPAHERVTALNQALAVHEGSEPFIYPFRFDNTRVPGLALSINYESLTSLHAGESWWKHDTRYKHPKYVAHQLGRILSARGRGPGRQEFELRAAEKLVNVRLAWVLDSVVHSADGAIPLTDLEDGLIDVGRDEADESIPVGRYYRVDPRLEFPINKEDIRPTFLIEGYTAYALERIMHVPWWSSELRFKEVVRKDLQAAFESDAERIGTLDFGSTVTVAHGPRMSRTISGVCPGVRPSR